MATALGDTAKRTITTLDHPQHGRRGGHVALTSGHYARRRHRPFDTLAKARTDLQTAIGQRIVGQEAVVESMLISLFAGGHSLFIGVPGLAKTLLVQTVADALGLSFGRVQFTPDLMPADITGTEVLHEDKAAGERVLRFMKGPVLRMVKIRW